MKIIFLDFDGVLNSHKYMGSYAYKKETQGMTGGQVMKLAHHAHIDPAALKILNKLVDQTGATVVVSSTWRIIYSVEELNKMCKARGATFTIVDKTPELPRRFSEFIPRGKEIQAYIDSLPQIPEGILIIDDWENMIHLSPYLLRTNEADGIKNSQIKLAIKILNKSYVNK